ncbi:AAA domain-containing protein [Falsiroseomonas sp.]|uniref:AAA domain-containing protein n=1 Tax=Falsiroseomonas sp. TaxID=2870721 RepID=UPI003564E5C9
MPEDKRKDLCSLLSYAEELLRITEKTVTDLSRDALKVFHQVQVARLEGVRTAVAPDEWLRVARLRETPPPEIDEMFDGWLSGLGGVTEPPRLADRLLVEADLDTASELVCAGLVDEADIMLQRGDDADPNTVDVILRTERMPELVQLYRDYVAGPWQAWAEAERPRRQSIAVYTSLFETYQRTISAGDDTPIECVFGVGLARWAHPSGRIDAPLIEATVELDLDEADSAIIVRPRQQPPRVNLRPFVALEINGAGGVQRDAERRLAAVMSDPDGGFDPFDGTTFDDVLRLCQARLSGTSIYEADANPLPPSERPLPAFDTVLRVSNSWVLYIRPRSVDFRCDDIRRLKERITEADETSLPGPAVRLASRPSNERRQDIDDDLEDDIGVTLPDAPLTRSGGGRSGAGAVSSDAGGGDDAKALFLPLPFNDEQAEIIARLEDPGSAGVVVQGPPGTGKTHTIANIICHYMARGRRVLVTARTPEALTAIQSKMPEEIRSLAIAVIHSDREGAKQLEEAVGILAREVANANADELRRDRADRERRLAVVREALARADREIRAYAERNLLKVPFRGEELLPMELAARVEAERPAHAWFTDRLDMEDAHKARFSGTEIAEARAIRARLGGDIVYPAAAIPDPAALPDAARLLAAHAALTRATESQARSVRGDLPYVAISIPGAAEAIRDTHAWLEGLGAWFDEIGVGGHAWVLVAYQILLEAKPADAIARQTLRTLLGDWTRLGAEGRGLALQGIEVPVPPGDAAFDAAVEKLSRGEKAFGLFGGGTLKAQLGTVRVAGATPSVKPPQVEAWKAVHAWRRWQREVVSLLGRWNAAAPVLGLQTLPSDLQAGAAEILRLGSVMERMHAFQQEAPQRLTVIGGLFPEGVDARQVVVAGKIETVREALAANLDRGELREGRELAARLGELAGIAPDLPLQRALATVADMLGKPEVTARDLAEAWTEVTDEAVRLAALRPLRERLEAIASVIAASGARAWATALLTERAETGVEDRWTPASWDATWEWARAAGFVARISDRQALADLQRRRSELEAEQRRLLAETVRLRTFLGLKRGITDQVGAALAKFVAAIRRIGAGTGRSAERHRRASREAALEAASAVPCWILPEWRVAEQLPSEMGVFDLVIVDEASQSDITALPVVLRGRKLLVVGDDKQVSPSAVGIEERFAIQLRETYLRGLHIASSLDPATSLYDIAAMTFPGSVTMLREHFRCVEPIIRFSSRFYPKALIPLRLPTVSERLDPPLVDVYIRGGVKQRDVNEAEAEWIVEEVGRITSDPAMAKRTIGVISLIGDKQAKRIADKLTARLGTDTLVRHRIMCGNAATFQGQERDIVFLSMVACPDTARSQTARTIQQRFNVAMSRARDRLYLVRSVRASDLSAGDLKLAVIEHFARPMEGVAAQPERDVLALCDSDFEGEVGRRLLERGYRLKAQVPVAGFRIDFVVEGEGDRRLAIELDGDQYHGPDRWADDLRRQRALERMGWVFWRCWGSHWLADPEGCMADLLTTLARMGIEPLSGDFSSITWTRHIVVDEAGGKDTVGIQEQGPDNDDRLADTVTGSAEPGGAAPEAPAADPSPADTPDAKEVVSLGDTVVVRFADTNSLRRFRIDATSNDPDGGVVHVSQPLAKALIGSSIDDEVEFDAAGNTRVVVVERILKAA